MKTLADFEKLVRGSVIPEGFKFDKFSTVPANLKEGELPKAFRALVVNPDTKLCVEVVIDRLDLENPKGDAFLLVKSRMNKAMEDIRNSEQYQMVVPKSPAPVRP